MEIDFSKHYTKGYFWGIMNLDISSLVEHVRNKPLSIDLKMGNPMSVLHIEIRYHTQDELIGIAMDRLNTICFEFSLKSTKSIGMEMYLIGIQRCNIEWLTRYYKQSTTRVLLSFVDKLALLFGVNRIFLRDGATPKEEEYIDLTLMTIMKDNQTFYEKYGYSVCDKDIPIIFEKQKYHLRNYNFEVFMFLLNDKDRRFIDKTLQRLKKSGIEGHYSKLHEFYVDAYQFYKNNIKYTHHNKELQDILTNSEYPWYPMVNVIQAWKGCMEKYID